MKTKQSKRASRPQTRPRIWVVEIWNDHTDRWETTVGVGLSRQAGRDEQQMWREQNPDDAFRLRPYVYGLR